MSKITFVVDFEDGQEPPVHSGMKIFGGSVVSVAFSDLNERIEDLESRTLKVCLPDIGSALFWHQSDFLSNTYKRFVVEAIQTAGIINRIETDVR